MGMKGIALGAYAVGLGCALLLAESGVAAGLGATLLVIVGVAAAARLRVRRSSRPRG
ncbi:MAG: hypothetical protein ABEJ97_09295 [Halobellus sp.]